MQVRLPSFCEDAIKSLIAKHHTTAKLLHRPHVITKIQERCILTYLISLHCAGPKEAKHLALGYPESQELIRVRTQAISK